MLLKHLFEDKNDKAQDAKELLDKVSTPSAISKATQLLRQILQKINPTQTIDEPPVSEDLTTDKEFAKNAIDEIAKTGNQEQLNAVISFLRGAELNELSSKAILANISQGIKGGLDQKLGQLVQNINAPFDQKEVFLNKMASGDGFWDGNDLLKNNKGNIYAKFNDTILKQIAKPIALQIRGALGYGPDQGPGEFLLALTGKGIGLAEKSDLMINGVGVEVKTDNGGIVNTQTGKKSRAGGRLYSTSGYGNASSARLAMYKTMADNGVPTELLAQYNWPKKVAGVKPPTGGLNFNTAGIGNLNSIFKQYLGQDGARKVLKSMVDAFYTDLPEGMDSQFISLAQSDGTIDPVQAQVELIAMAHDYYRNQEGHDYIMVFNSNNGEYVMIKDGNDVRSLMKSGDLKSTAAFDFFDDRSKGSPQLLTK